jgi:hypothetical protein
VILNYLITYRQVSITPMGLYGSHDAPTSNDVSSSSHPLAAGAVDMAAVAASVACDVVAVHQTRNGIFVGLFSQQFTEVAIQRSFFILSLSKTRKTENIMDMISVSFPCLCLL